MKYLNIAARWMLVVNTLIFMLVIFGFIFFREELMVMQGFGRDSLQEIINLVVFFVVATSPGILFQKKLIAIIGMAVMTLFSALSIYASFAVVQAFQIFTVYLFISYAFNLVINILNYKISKSKIL